MKQALNNPSLNNYWLMRNRNTALRHNHIRLCKRNLFKELLWRELSMYQGFEELTQGELEEALQFIQVMTELLHTIIMK